MKSLLAFLKKEALEQLRSGRVWIIGLLFVLFGIMNPAIAKLTPWLLEMMSDSMAQSGMTVTGVTVTALDSWVQFYKNVPMGLIAFVLLESHLFTREYASGTLVLSLTKGLERFKVVLAKTAVLLVLWTAGYWLCFGITYAYNAYYWDNSAAQHLVFSAAGWWVFGVWVIGWMILFSTLASANSGVLVGTGGAVFVCCLVGLLPKVSKYLPTFLTDGNSLIYGKSTPGAYGWAMVTAAVMSLGCIIASIPILNKKHL